jgi:hypothetical protein
MSNSAKNTKLALASKDSGWFIANSRRCVTTWKRIIDYTLPDVDGDAVLKTLSDLGDYPGWTGIKLAIHSAHAEGTTLIFESVDDSSG